MAKKTFSDFAGDAQKVVNAAGGKIKDVTAAAGAQVADAASKVGHWAHESVEQLNHGKKHKVADDISTKANETPKKEAEVKAQEDEEKQAKAKLDDILRIAIAEYNDAFTTLNDNGNGLYVLRTRAVDLILNVENLVNSIANRPKSFDTDIAQVESYRMSFTDVCEFAKEELNAAKKSAMGAGTGIAAGAAVASIAPTAAMWVATTFGVASTGTAISTLSGAAATNAALAWLGGGALAAGGGGISAGGALLALAGPVGWTLAGATLLTSISLFAVNKLKQDKKKAEEVEKVKTNTNSTRIISAKIQGLINQTAELRDLLNQQYGKCIPVFGKDFCVLSEDQQMQLGALVNSTKSLAGSLGISVE